MVQNQLFYFPCLSGVKTRLILKLAFSAFKWEMICSSRYHIMSCATKVSCAKSFLEIYDAELSKWSRSSDYGEEWLIPKEQAIGLAEKAVYDETIRRLKISDIVHRARNDHNRIIVSPKCEKGMYFLTIRPHPDLKFDRFKSFVETLFNRRCWRSGSYVWEQKGESIEEMGKGFHIHAILTVSSPSKGVGMYRQVIYETIQKCCLDDSIGDGNYHLRLLKTVKDVENVERCTQTEFFNKDTPSKEASWKFDQPWRLSKGLTSVYQVGREVKVTPRRNILDLM